MSAITGPFSHGHGAARPAESPGHGKPDNYLTHGRGLMSWLFTLDHKRIGLLYMMGVLTMFFIGGFFAVALRTMLWNPVDAAKFPEAATASYNLYNHYFSMHGAVMVFLFIIPA